MASAAHSTPPPPLAPPTPALVGRLVAQARTYEAALLRDEDAEALHQYRVCLRQARALLSFMPHGIKPHQRLQLRGELRQLMAPTGALRDLDVLLAQRPSWESALPVGLQAPLAPLYPMLAQRRQVLLNDLRQWLASDAYRAQLERLQGGLREAMTPTVTRDQRQLQRRFGRQLWRCYGRCIRAAGRIDADSHDAQFHRLRIQCKKLRYLLHYGSAAHSGRWLDRLQRRLSRLQQHLGAIHDAAMQGAQLRRLISEPAAAADAHPPAPPALPPLCAAAVGALLLHLERQQHRQRTRVLAALDKLAAPRLRRALRRRLGACTSASAQG